MNGSPRGMMLCIMGTVCNAAMMSTSGRILSEKLDVLRLAFYTAPVSCLALFPFCYVHEVSFESPGHDVELYTVKHAQVASLLITVLLTLNFRKEPEESHACTASPQPSDAWSANPYIIVVLMPGLCYMAT